MMTKENEDNIRAFYSHVSRLYSSSVSILTAIVFGWTAYIGLALNLIHNRSIDLANVYPIMAFVGVVIMLMAFFNFYFRVLHFGTLIFQLETRLNLVPYIEGLRLLPLVAGLVRRRDARGLTRAEKVTALILALYFIISFLSLFLLTPGRD